MSPRLKSYHELSRPLISLQDLSSSAVVVRFTRRTFFRSSGEENQSVIEMI